MKVIFYTRPNCGLCKEGMLTLKMVQEDHPFTIEERNIDERDDWTEQFGLMIPVVELDGEVIQYGQLDFVTISKRLQENT